MLVYLARLETIPKGLTGAFTKERKTNMMVHIIGYHRFLINDVNCKTKIRQMKETDGHLREVSSKDACYIVSRVVFLFPIKVFAVLEGKRSVDDKR